MTLDPYPDLPWAEPADTAGDEGERVELAALSEADSRLLEALSRPATHVVTAAEDGPPGARAARPSGVRRSPLTPVFQEPTG